MHKASDRHRPRLRRRLKTDLLSALACRPLLTVCLFFLLLSASLISASLFLRLVLTFGVLLFSLFFFLFCRSARARRERAVCAFLFLSALLLLSSDGLWYLSHGRSEAAFDTLVLPQGKEEDGVLLTGRVEAFVSQGNTSDRYLLRVQSVSGVPADAAVTADLDGEDLSPGMLFSGRASLARISEGKPENSVLSRDSRGAAWRAVFSVPPVLSAPASPSFGMRLREKLSSFLSGAEEAGFLRAVLLADRSGISAEVRSAFSRTGSSHLLALSGLHLSLLTGGLLLLSRTLCVPRRWALAACLLLAAGFLVLTGFPRSLLRAGLMMLFSALSVFLRLRHSPVQGLFCAGTVILMLDRQAITDLGFLLSFFATLGVLLAVPAAEKKIVSSSVYRDLDGTWYARVLRTVVKYLALTVAASLAAITFTLPVSAFAFGEVSFLSPVWGILLIPFFTVFLLAAFFAALCCFAGFGAGAGLFLNAADAIGGRFLDLVAFLSRHSPSPVAVTFPGVWVAVFVFTLYLFFCLWYRVPLWVPALSVLVFLAAFYACTLLSGVFSPPSPEAVPVQAAAEGFYVSVPDQGDFGVPDL